MKNDFQYKWSKIFASKRFHTKDGVIKLNPEEQQELLDDAEDLIADDYWEYRAEAERRD